MSPEVRVGVNLLREGLDLPEVALVAILDAARKLEFEKAALIRDQIETLQSGKHGGGESGAAKAKSYKKRKAKAVYNAKGMPKKKK